MKRKRTGSPLSGPDNENCYDNMTPVVPGPSKKMRRHSIGDLSEIDTINAPEQNMPLPNPEGGIFTTTDAMPEYSNNTAKIISDIEIRHQKELARKDKEYVAMKIDCEQQKSARVALEKRHKAELAALRNKHDREMDEAAKIAVQRFHDERVLEEQEEKLRLRRTLAEKKAVDAKVEAAKEQRRDGLLTILQEHNKLVRSLETRQKDGTLAFTKEEEVPSKQHCLDELALIWNRNNEWLERILPHELMADRDIALQFEVDIVAVRAFMLTLQCWNASARDVLQTGWSWTVLHRLNFGLVPYQIDTPLSTLSVAVIATCEMLQKAVMALQAETEHGVASNAGGMYQATGSTMADPAYQASRRSSDFEYPMRHGAHSALPSLGYTGASPPLNVYATNSAYMEEDPFEAEIRRLSHLPDAAPMRGTSYVDGMDVSMSTVNASTAKPCYNMANTGFCKFGDNCKFSHDVATGQGAVINNDNVAPARVDKRATMPCNNIKKFGSCRKNNCPFMHPPGTYVGDVSTDTMDFENQQPQQQPDRQCRNEQTNGTCQRSNCRWDHEFPHGPEVINDSGNFQPQENARGTKQCFSERDRGRCIKTNCQFAHQKPHGPTGNNNNNNNQGNGQRQQQQQQSNKGNGNSGGNDSVQAALNLFMNEWKNGQSKGNGLAGLSQNHMAGFQNGSMRMQGGNGGGGGGGRRNQRKGRGGRG